MIHGPSRILICPHCKSKKEVISLLSGNTSGGVVWSDQYVKYPFYETASYIQKCPHCEKYYIIDDETELPLSEKKIKELMGDTEFADSQCFQILNTKDYDWSKSTDNTGELDFPDMHRALIQLSKEVNTNEQKRKLYINYIHCFNTHFFRNNDKRRIPTPVNWAWLVDCVAKYIPLALESEIIFVAELQREIGLFDACIKTLEKLENEKQFYEFRKIIIEKARNKDSVIFIWKTICDEESSIYIREIPE